MDTNYTDIDKRFTLTYAIDNIFWYVTFGIIIAETVLRLFGLLPSRQFDHIIGDVLLFMMFMIIFRIVIMFIEIFLHLNMKIR